MAKVQLNLPEVPRKPGRPPTGKAKTAAQRKRAQRERDAEAIGSADAWNERQCGIILAGKYSDGLKRLAWNELGKLKGWN